MIDAGSFARRDMIPDDGTKGYLFGIKHSEDAAAVLRRFADLVEAGDVIINNVQSGQVTSRDGWHENALFIEYTVPVIADEGASA